MIITTQVQNFEQIHLIFEDAISDSLTWKLKGTVSRHA